MIICSAVFNNSQWLQLISDNIYPLLSKKHGFLSIKRVFLSAMQISYKE